MSQAHRVLWGEGMFLRPQHFQQHAHYQETTLAQSLSRLQAHPWGLLRIEVDEEALKAGLLRLDRLELAFPDGARVTAPLNDPLPQPRTLDTIPGLGVEALIHACLPALNAYGGNCSDGEAVGTPSRYLRARVQVPDLYTQALESELTILHANTRLMAEVENRDGLFSIPILRLTKDPSGRWQVDPRFIPPVLEIEAAPALPVLLRRLLDMCQVKSQALAAGHREQAHAVAGFGSADVASFWLLHTVNRTYPLLAHALRFPSLHPEQLYLYLAQMTAELLTFSSTLTLSSIPAYRHEALNETFDKLDELLRSLLETVISTRYALVALSEGQRPGFLTGRLEDHLLDAADFYLSVTSDLPAAQVIEAIPHRLKVGCPDDVEKILHSALPGVRLVHAPQTPSAIPVRIGNHYFALEKQSTLYANMLKARGVCIYKPQSLPDLKLELYAVLR